MFKCLIRKILSLLHLDITKNLKYDRLTQQIMSKVIQADSNCIDVGCHKGEILDLMLHYSPKGKHFAFEPIPIFYNNLIEKYQSSCNIYPYALSDEPGETSFQFVKNAPAYSGIKQRAYAVEKPDIEEIKVKLELLDNIIPESTKIDFIKIDVEGAEYGVLKGGLKTIQRNKPVIVFEFGLGASDFYGSKPEEVFRFLVDVCGLQVSNLSDWVKNKGVLSLEAFKHTYEKSLEYYFIAHPG